MNDYYVYAYYEPDSSDPFYVGKGRGKRATSHLASCKYEKETLFYSKLKSLLDSGIKPDIVFLLEDLSEAEATFQEMLYIRHFGRREDGGCLTNQTDGGDGISGYVHTEEARHKMSVGHLSDKVLAELRSPERRKAHSKRMKGNNHCKAYTDSLKIAVAAKCCGIVVEKFESLNAAERAGYKMSAIRKCLKNINPFAYNLTWEYA